MDEERNPSKVWCRLSRQGTASKKSVKSQMQCIWSTSSKPFAAPCLHHTIAGLRSLPRSMWCYNCSIPSGFLRENQIIRVPPHAEA